jgi:hypothetical protein
MHPLLSNKKNRLQPSGLMGPVRIIQAKQVNFFEVKEK